MVWDDPKLLGDSGEVLIFEWDGWRFDSVVKYSLKLMEKLIR